MSEEEILQKIKEKFGDYVLEASIPRPRRVVVLVPPEKYKEVAEFVAKDLGLEFLSCITGADKEEYMEVVAHIGYSIYVLVKTRIPRDNPEVDSLVDVLPAAAFYEREAYDLLGIVFKGNPDIGKKFIIPEDWPEGVFPLRKDYKPEHPKPLR